MMTTTPSIPTGTAPTARRGFARAGALFIAALAIAFGLVGWQAGWFIAKTSPLPDVDEGIPVAPAPAPARSPEESALALRQAIANSDYSAVIEHGKAVGRLGVTQSFLDEHGLVAPILQAAAHGDTQLFEALLQVNELRIFGVHREDGLEPIHVAASYGHVGIVTLLVERMNIPADRPSALTGTTPLQEAMLAGQCDLVPVLIELGADVNLQSGDSKKTALHRAVEGGRDACVEALLRVGADPTLRDARGMNAIEYARQYGADSLVRTLESASHRQ